MEEVKTLIPIAFWKTASFWAGIVPTVATALDFAFLYLAGENSGPVAAALAELLQIFGLDVTGSMITTFMQTLYPLYLAIFAWQRGTFSGATPRPYTASIEKERTVSSLVLDGRKVLDAAEALGIGGRH